MSKFKKSYPFYVVVLDQIESGWDFREDAFDRVKELKESGILSCIKTKKSIKFDFKDESNWVHGNINNFLQLSQ